MKNLSKRIVLATLFAQALCLGALEAVAQTYPALTLENAIEQAVLEDDWLAANVERKRMAGLTMIHFCTAGPLQVISRRLIALSQQTVTKLTG
ncbi:hypothetical protein N9350_02205 [Gammaproteobacteria bacterium]|nr:hypothetical protein [Gammaproteobacteria bacterium]